MASVSSDLCGRCRVLRLLRLDRLVGRGRTARLPAWADDLVAKRMGWLRDRCARCGKEVRGAQ